MTGQVPAEILVLILHLFRLYGKITPQQLRAKREAVEQNVYTILNERMFAMESVLYQNSTKYLALPTREYVCELPLVCTSTERPELCGRMFIRKAQLQNVQKVDSLSSKMMCYD